MGIKHDKKDVVEKIEYAIKIITRNGKFDPCPEYLCGEAVGAIKLAQYLGIISEDESYLFEQKAKNQLFA